MPDQQAHDAKEKQMEQSIPPPKQPWESVDMDYLTSKKSRPLWCSDDGGRSSYKNNLFYVD